ncbi:MAG: DUF4038 domain-containing protein [Bacteroidota bacterium]
MKNLWQLFLGMCVALGAKGCTTGPSPMAAPQWETIEIELMAEGAYINPYTEVSVVASFENEKGETISRPAFWDGGKSWKIRFASPDPDSKWTWQTRAEPADSGLMRSGIIQAQTNSSDNKLIQAGLLTMSRGKRSVIHSNRTPFLMIGDTPWALPYRATIEQVEAYAEYRHSQGFNTALLMVVQPDMGSKGPDARNTELGFARGFADLSDGHINQMNPGYFQYLDSLIDILLANEIVPVYQPVFHGFGWKGEGVLGNVIEPEEYVRFCRYLLGRYGSKPAMWLLAGDNGGKDPGVKEAGEMLENMDAYHQPVGLHYNPCDDFVAEWAKKDSLKHCLHYNKSYQDKDWLDFQWAQTGHGGKHQLHKVERMYDNLPTKAVANGEPTYEGMADGKNGLGWWQGHEAWSQLMSGGTMGVVYGAASLWQWKITADEPGWTAWASQPKSWSEALRMEGATYVGHMNRILAGLDWTDVEKHPELTEDQQFLLAKPGELYVSYLPEGGTLQIRDVPVGLPYRWVDPKTAQTKRTGKTQEKQVFISPEKEEPMVLIVEKN